MSQQHLVPLYITIANGQHVEASPEEYREFEEQGGASYAKWKTANRIAYGKKLLSEGCPHSTAWAQAFERYPDGTKKKPRFVFKKK